MLQTMRSTEATTTLDQYSDGASKTDSTKPWDPSSPSSYVTADQCYVTSHPRLLGATRAVLNGIVCSAVRDVANTSPKSRLLHDFTSPSYLLIPIALNHSVRLLKENISAESGLELYRVLTQLSDPGFSYCTWGGDSVSVFTREDSQGKQIGRIDELAKELDWLNIAIESGTKKPSTLTLTEIIRGIDSLLLIRKLETLDEILISLAIKSLHPVTTVAFIRNSFVANKQLKHWAPLVRKFRNQLLEDGLQVTKYLQGLENV